MRAQASKPNLMHVIYQARQDYQGEISVDCLLLSRFCRENHKKNKKQSWLAKF
jgi:hypothetical protein